ncbi:glycosyltransferase family 1 protein [Neobacillus sp. NRS-1170]|uniref:glycosyltransferase family 1 protein n=1 Tax=Neobacillus sp. NRS-1170 TaxID=3233898 RepID=UPI003D29E3B3
MKGRILQVQGGMNRGGTEAVIMGWYHTIDRDDIQFDFTTFNKEESAYDQEIRKMGGRIIYVPPRQEVGNLKNCYYLYKCIKENGPYLAVHTHNNFYGGIAAFIAKLAGVKKVIAHAHNTQDDGSGLKRKIEIFIQQKLLSLFADNLLACGKEAGEFVFGEQVNFELINNAVDMNKFRPADEERKQIIEQKKKELGLDGKLIIGHIGRFSKQKNHKFIISLIDKMKTRRKDFKFLLIGDGELKEEVLEQIRDRNMEEYVLYLGLQENISLWLNLMDVLILPSLYEGLPVVLVEAQSSGTPCVISNKITKDVDLGLDLVEFLDISHNEDEWCDVIAERAKSKIYDQTIIKNQLEKNGYSLPYNTKKVVDLYVKDSKRE